MRLGQRNATSEVTPRLVVGLHRGTCTAVLTHPSSSRHFVAVSMGRSDASAHPALVGFEKIEVGGGEGGRECVGGGDWNSVHFVEQILRLGALVRRNNHCGISPDEASPRNFHIALIKLWKEPL